MMDPRGSNDPADTGQVVAPRDRDGLVEETAEAMYGGTPPPWGKVPEVVRAGWRTMARAALAVVEREREERNAWERGCPYADPECSCLRERPGAGAAYWQEQFYKQQQARIRAEAWRDRAIAAEGRLSEDRLRERPDEDEWRYVPEYIEPHATCCDECKALRERPPLTEEEWRAVVDALNAALDCADYAEGGEPYVAWESALSKAQSALASSTTEEQRCHHCGLRNPGPEHQAHAPQLCAEYRG